MAVQEVLSPTYELGLVAVSFLISAFGAYAALAASTLVRSERGGVKRVNAAFAGVALGGVGIWSMHFLGMLAWNPGMAVGYGLTGTLLSLAVAVGVSAFALGYMAAARFSYRRLAVAGPAAGLGVSLMHFMGMGSMSFGGYLDWNWAMVTLAVLVAIVAATAALWLAFHVRRTLHRVVAAFVMAAAVCSMHYTGMAAADVVCTTASRFERMHGLLYGDEFRVLVIVVALGAAIIVAFDVFMQRVAARGIASPARPVREVPRLRAGATPPRAARSPPG